MVLSTTSKKGQRMLFIALACAFCMCVLTPEAFAQGQAGASALSTATSTIKGYIPLVQKLVYAIAGVVALVGRLSAYIKMNNEEQDVKKSIMMVVGACVFLVIAATALPAFFN